MSLVEDARRLELRNGDVVCLPADTDSHTVQAFFRALEESHKGMRFIIVLGDVQTLDESAMNAAGWYRK